MLVDDSYDLLVQNREMTDGDKENFLSAFLDKPSRTKVGLAVVGGAFGEGIDLVSERLIGVVVVGVGIPQICYERNLIRDYFDKVLGWANADISTISLLTAWYDATIPEDPEQEEEYQTRYKWYQDVLPFSKFNFKAEDLSELNRAIDFIYQIYY